MVENRSYPLYSLAEFKHLCELISMKAKSQPDDISFAWIEREKECQVTYKQFAEDVYNSSRIIKERINIPSHIGLLGNNSYQWLVLFAAIIDSGNVVVALDKDMLAEEYDEIMDRLDVTAVYADKKHIEFARLNTNGQAVFSMEEGVPCDRPPFEDEILFNNPDVDSPACVFLTSGTSGKRKGVVLSHRNLAADIINTCKMVNVPDTSLAVLPFHHTFGLTASIWMVFNYGHPIYISQGVRYLPKEMSVAKPQTMLLVPLYVENFYKQIMMKVKAAKKTTVFNILHGISFVLFSVGIDCRRKIFKTVLNSFGGRLDTIICGGAALDPLYIKKFRQFGIEILNGYGTTECSPVAAVNRNLYHKDGTVGLPIPNTDITVDENGEVIVSGDHVMVGYYHDEDATQEVLHGGRYYTGDLGYIDAEGFLVLTGRKKNLIILSSGENVSPEELEEKLLRIEGIDEVIVSEKDQKLSATIYSENMDENQKEIISEKIEQLNKTLPMYKRITAVYYSKEPFKKTTTMKIIRS